MHVNCNNYLVNAMYSVHDHDNNNNVVQIGAPLYADPGIPFAPPVI